MYVSFKAQIYQQVFSPGMMRIMPGNDINQILQFANGILLKAYSVLLHG